MSALDPYDTVLGPFASQDFADAVRLGPLPVPLLFRPTRTNPLIQ